METKFKNIENALRNETLKEFNRFVEGLSDAGTTTETLLNSWHYKELMTAGARKKVWELQPLKEYLIEREKKQLDKRLNEKLQELIRIENSQELVSIDVSIEWKRSKTWGNNPSAEAKVNTKNDFNRYYGSASGCGYDKESTAIAQAVNQSDSFKKMLYEIKENNINTDNRELFGYGAGYGILPYLEGGVGVSCYPAIFKKIGFDFHGVAHGKTFDVYTANKIQEGVTA